MTAKKSYREFWPEYLSEHANPINRGLHFAGTGAGLICLVAGLVLWEWMLIVAGPVLAYGLAWFGHFAVERNAPAAFGNPLWSLVSDIRMLALWLTGQLGTEFRRQGIGDGKGAG